MAAFEMENNTTSMPGAPYVDSKKAGQSLIGKKILPTFNG
jgi:hypothetical protein